MSGPTPSSVTRAVVAAPPIALGLLALALIASGCDGRKIFVEPTPGLHRMLVQPRADPYEPTPVFRDGKVMQRPPYGTVPRTERLERGQIRARVLYIDSAEGTRIEGVPFPVNMEVLEEGRRRFEIYCAVCHGMAGYSDSYVAKRMTLLRPRPLHSDRLRQMPLRHFYDVMTQGWGLMSSYAPQLGERERWAIAAYVRALQISQHVPVDELSADERERIQSAPAPVYTQPGDEPSRREAR